MYLDFYGFREAPFNITPDPRFLYFSARHREALEHLLYGIRERKGFVQITGEVGAGKTTLCRAALERLGPIVQDRADPEPGDVVVAAPAHDPRRARADAARANRPCRLSRDAQQFLLAQVPLGQDVVLLIDEAQDLSAELLEQVRLLSNLETDSQKLLQIVLIGQPELKAMLDDSRLANCGSGSPCATTSSRCRARRPSSTSTTGCRSPAATAARRSVAGRCRKIHRYSTGVPRLINAVCDTAMLAGYVSGVDHLSGRQIGRAIRELEGKPS